MRDSNPETLSELLIERQDGVAVLTLNRPRAANTMGLNFGSLLLCALEQVEAEPDISAIVLTGAGKAFCGGGSLGEVMKADDVDMEQQFDAIRNTFKAVQKIRELDLPVVCALNGAAVGGGAALAMACDLVVAADTGYYSFPFGKLGATAADMGCAHMLQRIVGTARAREILYTGAKIDATQGRTDGLFVKVVPRDAVLAESIALARQVIAAGPRRAVAGTKQVLLRGESVDYATCVTYELYLQCFMLNMPDHKRLLREFFPERK